MDRGVQRGKMREMKQRWTEDEEAALREGVEMHGAGKWKQILDDPDFSPHLSSRTNIDLKDKWRNMAKRASRTPELKARPFTMASSPETPIAFIKNAETLTDPSSTLPEADISPWYTSIMAESICSMQKPNDSDNTKIGYSSKEKHVILPNIKTPMTKWGQTIVQNKVEKVHKGYLIKDSSFALRTPTQKSEKTAPEVSQPVYFTFCEPITIPVEGATPSVVARADVSSSTAAERVEEASKMEEETEVVLQLSRDTYRQCKRKAEKRTWQRCFLLSSLIFAILTFWLHRRCVS